MSSARDELITELITERGMSVEQAVEFANRVYPKSAPRRVVEHSAEIVDAAVSPVAEAASLTSGVVKSGIRMVFGKY